MKEFLHKLLLLWKGELPDYNQHMKLMLRVAELEVELLKLKSEKKNKIPGHITIPVSGFDDMSDEPTSQKERKQYAAQVSEFYETILQAKIRTSIAQIRELLAAAVKVEDVNNQMSREQYDFLLRGMEAGLWKIHNWATLLQGELKNK